MIIIRKDEIIFYQKIEKTNAPNPMDLLSTPGENFLGNNLGMILKDSYHRVKEN